MFGNLDSIDAESYHKEIQILQRTQNQLIRSISLSKTKINHPNKCFTLFYQNQEKLRNNIEKYQIAIQKHISNFADYSTL